MAESALDIGMIVFSRGLIAPDLRRLIDLDAHHARLEPMALGTTEGSAPLGDLRRYRIRTTDVVAMGGRPVAVRAILNPQAVGELYRYEVETDAGDVVTASERQLSVHEGGEAPDPASMLVQRDGAPWELVGARQALLASFFRATARSMGLAGYTGARMLPIPHQLNAARYAILFGRVRFLLADEVGLGKTVEAGLILSTLRKYFPAWRAAIFVPESLTAQWAFEMYGKFGKTVFSLDLEDLAEDDPGIILPHARAAEFLAAHGAEILIVDEAHRVLGDPATYDALRHLSGRAHAVLLLTATPRADDSANLRRLLQLVDPEQFGGWECDDELTALLEKQGRVEECVRTLRRRDADVGACVRAWRGLEIDDPEVEELIDQKRPAKKARPAGDPDDSGERPFPDRHALRHAAASITDRYYPGARILRYQRKFLARDNAMAMRIVAPVEYRISATEEKVLGLTRRWLDAVRDAGHAGDADWQTAAATLMQAAHSSPMAVDRWVEARRGVLEVREGVTADAIRLARATIAGLPPLPGEGGLLEAMAEASLLWFRDSRPDNIVGIALSELPRTKAAVDLLRGLFRDEPDTHVLLFTGFEANVRVLFQHLRKEFTGVAEVFHLSAEQPWREREKNAFAFQDCITGSILVSDELGGEGRNFQFVHTLLHFDLPVAPWLVEQRIGRCDRVGRDEELDVDSQVMVARGQLDEALFEFLAEGVNVFNESIAAVEGALDDVSRRMVGTAIERGAQGVLDEIEPTTGRLDEARAQEERDLLARSRIGVEEAIRAATEADDARELDELRDNTVRYARLFESMVDERTDGRLAVTVGEFHTLRDAPGVLPEMIGYFTRRQAVRHERLDFFSPGHPYVRRLALATLEDSPDRVAFVARRGIAEPAIAFVFRVQLDPEFFEEVGKLPIDLRPPLFCQSAAAFGTTFVRAVVTLRGVLLHAESPVAAPYAEGVRDDDVSLESEKELAARLGDEWDAQVENAALVAQEEADRFAAARLASGRDSFEDLLCEVLSRLVPTQEWLEDHVGAIMSRLNVLTVDMDSAVAFFPRT